ncbi:MAG: outer membrane beta-barrel protein [Deltaproteobacteria bacterium]|nr:outer membrane beta-barrel protein [Deltaproteobacteria bacterium]
MKDFKLFLLIAALIVLMISPALAQSGQSKVRIIIEKANVRLEPDPDSKIITSVPMGAILAVTFQKGEWFMAELPKNEQGITITGYLHISDVEVISGAAPQQKTVAPPPPQPVQTQTQAPPPPPPMYDTQKKGGFKIMGGLSMANVSFPSDPDVTEKPKYRMGFIAGIGYEFNLAPSFAVEVNALYHQKGFKYEEKSSESIQIGDDIYTYEDKLIMKTDELSVPILLKYKFPGSVAFYLAGGFEVAFVLSNKADYTGTTYKNGAVDNEEKSSTDVKEFTSSMDYGAVFGGGIGFAMGKSNLVIDARYYLGLANLLDNSSLDETSDDWLKSRAIVIMLGLAF